MARTELLSKANLPDDLKTSKIWDCAAIDCLTNPFSTLSGIVYMERGTDKDGFEILQSHDKAHWVTTKSFTVDSGETKGFTDTIIAKWVKIKVTLNDPTPTTPGALPEDPPVPTDWVFKLGLYGA